MPLQIELAERPRGGPIIPGKTFRQRVVPAPTPASLKDGELLLESLYFSLDPAMRGWINNSRSYVEPVRVGAVMAGSAVCRVLASRSARARPGDVLVASLGFREVGVVHERLIDAPLSASLLPANARVTDLLGVLGLTGLTAYFGMDRIGRPRPGETVVVSGAAGATGSVVVQLARLNGARVVATAGSADKCRWLREELGADVALNYKDADFRAQFTRATPDFVNVYWDNVGGEQLEMALDRAAPFSRFVMCGSISGYNATKPNPAPRNLFMVTTQRIRMEGFIVMDFASEYDAARAQLAQWLGEGKIKREQTIVQGGLKNFDVAFEKLFKGENIGKLLLEVKNPDEKPGPRL